MDFFGNSKTNNNMITNGSETEIKVPDENANISALWS